MIIQAAGANFEAGPLHSDPVTHPAGHLLGSHREGARSSP